MRKHISVNRFKKFGTPRVARNIVGFNNTIQNHGAKLNQVQFNIQGDHNIIIIHPGAVLNNVSFNLYGDHHRIIIGKNVHFNERGSIWAEDNNCLISIGEDSTFEGVHMSATEPGSRLIIGQDCMFSYDIDLRTGDSHTILDREQGARVNYAKDIVFGDHIWVASHCIFTKGSAVGSHSIVGTGSLINKAFEDTHVLLAGRPAKIMKRDVEWLRERIYDNQAQQKQPPQAEVTTLNFVHRSQQVQKVG